MLEKISINKEIKNALQIPIPINLIKERTGARKMQLKYISGSTVTDLLNNIFGYNWDWQVTKVWIQESSPYCNKYSSGKYSNNPNDWKMEEQLPVAHVLGTLTVKLKDEETNEYVTISKSGLGSKSVLGNQSEQESIFKAAGTDALKKAASLLGIGLELYRDEEEANFFYTLNYEDPWTEEEQEKHKESLNYLNEYKSLNELNDEDLYDYIYGITGTDYVITPDNIELVVSAIKKSLEQ